jgi:hypothetical protein
MPVLLVPVVFLAHVVVLLLCSRLLPHLIRNTTSKFGDFDADELGAQEVL